MSGILDMIAPVIPIYKYLGKELVALRETFDRNWDEKHDEWKDHTIEWQLARLDTERVELEEAIKEMWEHATTHSSLIERMKHVNSEFLDVALVALLGANKTRIEIEKLISRINKEAISEAQRAQIELEDAVAIVGEFDE